MVKNVLKKSKKKNLSKFIDKQHCVQRRKNFAYNIAGPMSLNLLWYIVNSLHTEASQIVIQNGGFSLLFPRDLFATPTPSLKENKEFSLYVHLALISLSF